MENEVNNDDGPQADNAPVAGGNDNQNQDNTPEVDIDDEDVPLSVLEDDEIDIEDEETPLAANKDNKRGWLWSIIPLIVATITGKKYYDHKTKKRTATAAGIDADEMVDESQKMEKDDTKDTDK